MYFMDVTLGNHLYQECDEFTMTVGKTYLVHSDATGFFLGTYAYASRRLGAYIFHNCHFYTHDYYGNMVLSGQPDKADVTVSMVGIVARS
jgi:hypothetical protein